MIHSRLRLSTLENLSAETILTPSRRGLPPRVLQRICEHIEAHIEEKISVDALASRAFRATFHSRVQAFHRITAAYLCTAAAGMRGVDASQHAIAVVGDRAGNGIC